MNRDEITRMAQEAGIKLPDAPFPTTGLYTLPDLIHFAALVATAERKQCEKVCKEAIDEDSSFQWNLAVKYCLKTIQART